MSLVAICLLVVCLLWGCEILRQTSQGFFEGAHIVPREEQRAISRRELCAWVAVTVIAAGMLILGLFVS